MKSCTADGGMEVCEHEGVGLEEAMFYSKVVGRTLYLAFASVTWRKFLLVSWLRRDTGLSTCRKREGEQLLLQLLPLLSLLHLNHI